MGKGTVAELRVVNCLCVWDSWLDVMKIYDFVHPERIFDKYNRSLLQKVYYIESQIYVF